jgi:uncharacterized protein
MKTKALRLASEFRKRLTSSLGQPVRVVLFGSQARGDATSYSDIDLFVVLPNMKKATLDTALDIAWEIGFEAEKVISVIPATESELKKLSASPFFRTVQKEGIPA